MHTRHPLLDRETEVEIVDDSHEPWLLVRCKETDFHFIANPPTYDRLAEEFAWEKTLDAERERRDREERMISIASDVAKKLKVMIRPNRNKMFAIARRLLQRDPQRVYRVLDVGCGNGKIFSKFCQRFRDVGVTLIPFGIEVSSHLARVSGKRFARFGGEVIENNAIDGMKEVEPETIDMVTMHSFLEHESHPRELLQAIRGAIRPDGFVLLKVPNFACWNRIVRGRKWAGYRFPDHVNYFTPDTLKLLAEEAGFELVPQNLTERFPTNDNMYAVLTRAAS